MSEETPMNLEELTVKVVENEQRSKNNEKQIGQLAHQQEEMNKMLKIMFGIQEAIKNIKEDLCETKADVKKLTEQPGKKWAKVVETVIVVAVSAIVGFVLRGIA